MFFSCSQLICDKRNKTQRLTDLSTLFQLITVDHVLHGMKLMELHSEFVWVCMVTKREWKTSSLKIEPNDSTPMSNMVSKSIKPTFSHKPLRSKVRLTRKLFIPRRITRSHWAQKMSYKKEKWMRRKRIKEEGD